MNNYSFKLIAPRRNRFLKVEAANKAEAKKKLLQELSKISKRLIKVYRLKEGSNE
jgi:hypothetical protein|tara:strand:+ start:518 stop:682 length:165 start_codon:yes stop_codon:yes gene_type:complete